MKAKRQQQSRRPEKVRKGRSAKLIVQSPAEERADLARYFAAATFEGIGISEKGMIIEANSQLAQMLGCEVSELIGKPVANFVAPESLEDVMRHIQSGSDTPYEHSVIRKDGSRFPVEVRGREVIYRDRKIRVTAVQDITDRKNAEQRRRDSEQQFESLVEAARDLIVVVSADATILSANLAAEHITGWKRAEWIGRPFTPLVHPDDLPKALHNLKRAMRGEGSPSFELRVRRASGMFVDIELTIAPLRKKDGIGSVICVGRDITERKQVESELLKLRKAVVDSGEAIFLTDRDGLFTFVNPEFTRLYGYTAAEVVGKTTPRVLKSGGMKPEDYDVFWQTLLNKQVVKGELINKTKDGRSVNVGVSINPILDNDQNVTGFLAIQRNITERKKNDQRLRIQSAVTSILMDAQTFDEAMLRILKVICDGLGWKRGEFWSTVIEGETKTNSLQCTQSYSSPSTALQEFERVTRSMTFQMGVGLPGRVWASSQPIWIEDVTKDEFFPRVSIAPKEAIQMGIGFPVMVGKEVLGVMEFFDDNKAKPDVNLLQTFESIGAQIGQYCKRKRAEEGLLENARLLRESQSIAGLGSYVMDILTGIWKSSEVLDKIFGIDDTFARSTEGWASLVHPDWREMMLSYFNDEVLTKQCRFDKEYKIIRKEDGEERWVHGIGELAFDSQHKPTKMTGSILDITERKQAEGLIQRQKAYFQNLFENSTLAIAMLDKSEMILDINKAFELTFQYTKGEITGKNINDIVVPDSLKDEGKELTEKAKNKQDIQKETVRKRKDGKLVNVSVHGFPININGELVGIYGVYEDISERKKLEKQFLHAQRMDSVGTLAGGIAHDFNNILGIIMAYASLLQKGGTKPEEMSSGLSIILNAVKRGSDLARQILTFAHKGDPIMEDVRVNDVLKDLDKMLKVTFPKNIEIRFDLDSLISPVAIDSGQFHQAMLNLCVNGRDAVLDAVKQGSSGGIITIKTRLVSAEELIDHKIHAAMGSYVAITVSDTGVGMSEETKQRIFEPFFTTKEQGRGTGLGLAVVYGIVKSHQGFIDVKSQIGRGTDFVLYFPARRIKAKDKTSPMQGLREAPGGSETILLVEDEMELSELLKNLLLSNGYTVLTAANGLEAVEVFARNKDTIRLVLSDQGLPKLSGIEAYKKMKRMDPKVKVILVSGFIDPNQKSEILKSGIREFVQKPYDPREVLIKMREVLDK